MVTPGILSNSLQVRRRAIAYLHQQVPALQRVDNIAFYDELSTHGVDLPEMAQAPQELVLVRRGGPSNPEHVVELRVGAMAAAMPGVPGMPVPAAFRCVFSEQGSHRAQQEFVESADTVHEAFVQIWGPRVGLLQLVEVSYMATVAVNHPEGSVAFLRDSFMRTAQAVTNHLGRNYDGLAVKYVSNPVVQVGQGGPPVPLLGAHIEFALEPFLQDPRQLFMNFTVKWPLVQMRLSDIRVPEPVRAMAGTKDFLELNVEAKAPKSYLESAYQYVENNVLPFIAAAGR